MNVDAVLWDFDGTLVDTAYRSFSINQKIFSMINTEENKEKWPVSVHSFEEFKKAIKNSKNWQELYLNHFKYSEKQTNEASSLWSKLQLEDEYPITIFEGISNVLKELDFVPHGICSQNCSTIIQNILKQNNVDHHFKSIIGYKDVSYNNQKPDPMGFISCLEKMKLNNFKTLYYIGDHQEDVHFAKNAERVLRQKGHNCSIFTIAVCYNGLNAHDWDVNPDFKANTVKDIVSIIR